MKYEEIKDLHSAALTMKNMAEQVLSMTDQLLVKHPIPKRVKKTMERKAALTAKLLAGKRKSDSIRKTNRK